MKKITFLIGTFIIAISSFPLLSQTQVNIMTGFNTANTETSVISSDIVDISPISRLNASVILDQKLDDLLSLRTGLVYQKKGFKVNESMGLDFLGMNLPLGIKLTNEINYLEVPVMLKFNINNKSRIRPYLAAGPSLGYALSGSLKTKATAILDFNIATIDMDLSSDNYNRIDISAKALAGVEIPYKQGHFITEIGYTRALNNFVSQDFILDAGGKHKGWTFNVGYGFRF